MKFKVTQKNLNDCLKNVAPFADKGHQLDIIKNILLKTNKNLLEVSATNLDTSIVERVQGSCTEEGSITVPTSLFRDYVQNLPPEEKIELQLDDKKLTVTCKNTKAVVNGLSPENYPNFPVNKKLKPFLEIEAGHLRDDLARVVFAANKDISRPILTGVFLHVFENEFYLAATDGYRLAEKKVTKALNKPPAKAAEMQVLIPASAVMSLERVLSAQPSKKISLYKEEDEKNVLFIVGDGEIEITALPLEGTYPDYRKLLPEKFSTEITVDRNDLVNAVKRAGLFSQEGPSSVILNWEAKKDKLNIKSSASQVGGNDEDVEAEVKTTDKGDATIVLNSRYLQDVLGVMGSQSVRLGLNSKLDPCLLTGCEGAKGEQLDDGYRHAIMPLKP
ncbi:DNA polymerase III subunit beta [Candidatus Saccharibacteria bacterium]|nr:DNA polymerase III subunit beta [Candidatus Saccharibacteria bacterium]